MQTRTIRACGAATLAGAAAWSAAWLAAGPPEEGVNEAIEIWGSFAYQLGLVALLVVMRGTDATGTSRWGRIVLSGEMLLVGLAIAWTVPHLSDANYMSKHDNPVLVVLDAAWPLSMLGLIAVGVAVIRARRWSGALRWLPLAASLLLPVDVLAAVLLGPTAELVLRAGYLALTYGALGVLLLQQPPDADRSPADEMALSNR